MSDELRVVVTDDASDYVPAFRRLLDEGERCAGVMISWHRSMPRRRATIGLFVEALERELNARPAEDALEDQVLFLRP